MLLRLWGTRGSSPATLGHDRAIELIERLVRTAHDKQITDLDQFLKACQSGELGHPLDYGGHTPCSEVETADGRFVIDMGTGLREFGTKYLKTEKEFHIFVTHMHWDHVMGLPFFIPIFVPGTKIHIYHVHKTTPQSVRGLFDGVHFPVTWENLGAEVNFHQLKLYEGKLFGETTITPYALDHPGGSFGYHFSRDGKSINIGVDGEYKRVSREDLGADLKYYQNLDVLLFDAQYEMEELAIRFDWGHSSATIGVDLALREGIKNLVLIHHDPWATYDKLKGSVANAARYSASNVPDHKDVWDKIGQNGPNIISGFDGLEVKA